MVAAPEGAPLNDVSVQVSDQAEPSFHTYGVWPFRRPDDRGRVTWSGLPIGATWFVHLVDPNDRYRAISIPFDTPAVDGGRAEVGVRFARRNLALTGTAPESCRFALVPDGTSDVDALNLFLHPGLRAERSRANPGCFRIVVPSRISFSGGGTLVAVDGAESPQKPDDPLRIARVELPQCWPEGDLDVGHLEPIPLPIFASGRVVDCVSRAPVADRRVRVRVDVATTDTTEFFETDAAADGTFVLRGPRMDGRWLVSADDDADIEEDGMEFEPGATGLEVEALPLVTVTVPVRLPAGVSARLIRTSAGSSAATRYASLRGEGEDAILECGELEPGSYRVSLAGSISRSAPLHEFEFEITRDGRARGVPESIDLRGRAHAFSILAADERAEPMATFQVRCVADPYPFGWRGAAGNPVALVDAASSLDVIVTAPGRRATLARIGAGAARVALAPAMTVKIVVPPEQVPPLPWRLLLDLRARESVLSASSFRKLQAAIAAESAAEITGKRLRFDASGTVSFELPIAGSFDARLVLDSAIVTGDGTEDRVVSETRTIDVVEQTEPQEFALAVDAARAAAVRR